MAVAVLKVVSVIVIVAAVIVTVRLLIVVVVVAVVCSSKRALRSTTVMYIHTLVMYAPAVSHQIHTQRKEEVIVVVTSQLV